MISEMKLSKIKIKKTIFFYKMECDDWDEYCESYLDEGLVDIFSFINHTLNENLDILAKRLDVPNCFVRKCWNEMEDERNTSMRSRKFRNAIKYLFELDDEHSGNKMPAELRTRLELFISEIEEASSLDYSWLDEDDDCDTVYTTDS